MSIKIDHINIVTSDLESAREFFAALGFTVRRSGELAGSWIANLTGLTNVKADYIGMTLPNDSVVLELLEFHSPIGNKDDSISQLNQIGYRHLALRVDNIDEVIADLKSRNIQILSAVQSYEPLSKRLCYVIGPDGVVIE